MVRPDSMRLEDISMPSDGGPCFPVMIRDRSYLGDSVQYTALTPWEQVINVRLSVSHGQSALWGRGDVARVAWDVSHSTVYYEK